MTTPLHTIISGGQTGADRAALDAAIALDFACGGWCPQGRLTQDGTLPAHYPLQELIGAGYRQRTIKNLESSDGTAIFYSNCPTGGTELTLTQCIRRHRPYQLIDVSEITPQRAGAMLYAFVQRENIGVLNVAGPSAKSHPAIYGCVREAVEALIGLCRG